MFSRTCVCCFVTGFRNVGCCAVIVSGISSSCDLFLKTCGYTPCVQTLEPSLKLSMLLQPFQHTRKNCCSTICFVVFLSLVVHHVCCYFVFNLEIHVDCSSCVAMFALSEVTKGISRPRPDARCCSKNKYDRLNICWGLLQRWADCEIFQSESSPDPIKLNPIQSWSAKFLKIISPIQSWSTHAKRDRPIFILPREAKALLELFCP